MDIELLNESFKKFQTQYLSTIEGTGNKKYAFDPSVVQLLHNGLMPTEVNRVVLDEYAIIMDENELKRFLGHYNQFLDILNLCSNNPIIMREFHKLIMLVNLSK